MSSDGPRPTSSGSNKEDDHKLMNGSVPHHLPSTNGGCDILGPYLKLNLPIITYFILLLVLLVFQVMIMTRVPMVVVQATTLMMLHQHGRMKQPLFKISACQGCLMAVKVQHFQGNQCNLQMSS